MSEEYIKNISEKGNAIIVGRGANSILKEYNPINIDINNIEIIKIIFLFLIYIPPFSNFNISTKYYQ